MRSSVNLGVPNNLITKGQGWKITSMAAHYTTDSTDGYFWLLYYATPGDYTVTLDYTAASGLTYIVRNFLPANTITIDPDTGNKLNGSLSTDMELAFNESAIVGNIEGTNEWFAIKID